MFFHAASFNSDISGWSVESVQNLNSAFFGAASFRSDVSGWAVKSVVDVSRAFAGATSFDRNLCAWGRRLPGRAVTRSMFLSSGCEYTDDPDRNNIRVGPFCGDCGGVSTPILSTNSSDLSWTFGLPFTTTAALYSAVDQYLEDSSPSSYVASLYGHPIGQWRVGSITDFSRVFDAERNPTAAYFNEPLDWDTSRAITMSRMFAGAATFDSDISGFVTSSVTNTSGMCEFLVLQFLFVRFRFS